MTKKIMVLLLACVLCVSTFVGCGSEAKESGESKESIVPEATSEPEVPAEVIVEHEARKANAYNIVCTDVIPYDWVREIMGTETQSFNLTLVLVEEAEKYEPSGEVTALFENADIIIYTGGEEDAWIDTMIDKLSERDRKIFNLLDLNSHAALAEEVNEGMDAQHSETCDGVDNNIYLSLVDTVEYVRMIYEAMAALEYNVKHQINSNYYMVGLNNLRADYSSTFGCAYCPILIMADNHSVAYLIADLGADSLKCYAALPACSEATEVSDETIQFLAKQVDSNEAKVILVNEDSDGEIAKKVNEATANQDCQILTLNTLQSISEEDLENGFHYLTALEANVEVLRKATMYLP